jgi:hypothetical protein
MMPCGHPLAARRVIVKEGRLESGCWACAVEREIISKIVGPGAMKRRAAGVK